MAKYRIKRKLFGVGNWFAKNFKAGWSGVTQEGKNLSNWQRAGEFAKGTAKVGGAVGVAGLGAAQLAGVPVTGVASDMHNMTKEDF